jgi:hypothetical protein
MDTGEELPLLVFPKLDVTSTMQEANGICIKREKEKRAMHIAVANLQCYDRGFIPGDVRGITGYTYHDLLAH